MFLATQDVLGNSSRSEVVIVDLASMVQVPHNAAVLIKEEGQRGKEEDLERLDDGPRLPRRHQPSEQHVVGLRLAE